MKKDSMVDAHLCCANGITPLTTSTTTIVLPVVSLKQAQLVSHLYEHDKVSFKQRLSDSNFKSYARQIDINRTKEASFSLVHSHWFSSAQRQNFGCLFFLFELWSFLENLLLNHGGRGTFSLARSASGADAAAATTTAASTGWTRGTENIT